MVAEVQLDALSWVKTRSSLDPTQSNFLMWTGTIYAFVPGEKRQPLFKIEGMSVSRCTPMEEGGWYFTSRELTYYLDPQTGKILQEWQNPWTGESVPVMHVANSPVQGKFKGKFPARVDGDSTTYVFDIFPHYPNPLATDPKFAPYSSNATYQAAELFKLTVPTADLTNPELKSVSQVKLGWDRIGPWLPWMKMGDIPGQMIYSAYGGKVNDVSGLPQVLQDEINTRVPLYKQAPKAYVEEGEMTSWIYFQKHFDAYLAGENFPLPAAEES